MATLIPKPVEIKAAGNKIKIIKEFIGGLNTKTSEVSIALMQSPSGWSEPGQTPEFNEYSFVIKGTLRISSSTGHIDVHAGQAAIAHKGEWVQYSTPTPDGAEYLAVCVPAFSMDAVHRDAA